MITLALDASTYEGSLAVLDGNRVLAEGEAVMRGRDAELLLPAVDATLRKAGYGVGDIDRVVCGAGPGSFTSLRIAASLAKGIAIGRGIPLFALSSLALIVAGNAGAGKPVEGPQRYLAVLDALRGESYIAEFELDEDHVRQTAEMRRIPSSDVSATAAAAAARVVGPHQPTPWSPKAGGVALMSLELDAAVPVNLAGWEPMYGRMAEAQAKWEAAHGRALPR